MDLFDVFQVSASSELSVPDPSPSVSASSKRRLSSSSSAAPVSASDSSYDDADLDASFERYTPQEVVEMPTAHLVSPDSLKSCRHERCYPPNWDFSAAPKSKKLRGEPAKVYPFELDPFQKIAVDCLEAGESVLVSAHTSAGKTVVAEYAVAMALKAGQRVIYTSPIKALSNQKYRELYREFKDVGLMTGDTTINPSASCLVMTTEILRNMLYRGSEVVREVAWVCMDEIHYMRNKERGVVWEETMILLNHSVRYVFLSATIPNATEFASWIAKLHYQPCNVVYTDYRPTPLQHYLFPSGGDSLYLAVDEKGVFREDNFQKAIATLKSAAEPSGSQADAANGGKDKKRKSGGGKKGSPGGTDIYKIVRMVMERDYHPVIVFSFSKRECETHALHLAKLDFCSPDEKHLIGQIFHNAIDSLSEDDKKLPQVENILPLLKRGIGIHHSGLLPILKEIVEILFGEGLLKCLFSTETFSMGLNMPARCFPESDTRVLTDQGFLFLDQIERLNKQGNNVQFASYDEKSKAIRYVPGSIVISPPATELIEFTQAEESRAWAGNHSASHNSNHVSIRTTANHQMYVQEAMIGNKNEYNWKRVDGLSNEVTANGDDTPASERPHALVDASKLLESAEAIRFLACAANGVDRSLDIECPAFIDRLCLNSADQIHAFLELYGFFLGAGSLTYIRNDYPYLRFCSSKQSEWEFIESMMEALDLQRHEDWAVRDVTQFLNGTLRRAREYLLQTQRYGEYFDVEYGSKYPSSRYYDPSRIAHPELSSDQWFFSWVLKLLNPEETWRVIRGLWRSDASWNHLTASISTESATFRDQLVHAIINCGLAAHFYFGPYQSEADKNYANDETERNSSDLWRIQWSKLDMGDDKQSAKASSACMPVLNVQDEVKRVPYQQKDGRLWCVDVGGDHLIIAQRAARSDSGLVIQASRPIIIGNCCVFSSLMKWDGDTFRMVSSGEYIQMAGRAGRRGLDSKGIVIAVMDEEFEPVQAKGMIKGQSDLLNSSFHLGYNMLLNLLRVEDQTPIKMIARSFHQFQSTRKTPALREKIEMLRTQQKEILIEAPESLGELFDLEEKQSEIRTQLRSYWNQPKHVLPFLNAGRLIELAQWGWAICLGFQRKANAIEPTYLVEALVPAYLDERALKRSKGAHFVKPEVPKPGQTITWHAIPVALNELLGLSTLRLYVQKDMKNAEARATAGKNLDEVQRRYNGKVPLLELVKDFKVTDSQAIALNQKLEAIQKRIEDHPAKKLAKFAEEMEKFRHLAALRREIQALEVEVENCSTTVALAAELRHMQHVLRRMDHTNQENVIALKGRIAAEISTCDELLATELIFNGVFNPLTTPQCVALCSVLIFSEKSGDEQAAAKLREELAAPFRQLQEAARRVAQVKADARIEIDQEKYVEQFKSDLMEVAFAWCAGEKFSEICKLTDIFEGSIIRSMRRLEELLRQMAAAAKSVGNAELENKFQDGIKLIKRDIVFAASLYL